MAVFYAEGETTSGPNQNLTRGSGGDVVGMTAEKADIFHYNMGVVAKLFGTS